MKSTPLPHRYLTLKFAAVAILPIIILGYLTTQILLPNIHRQTRMHHINMAHSVSNQVTAHLMGGERQLLALSTYLESIIPFSSSLVSSLLDTQCGNGDLFETIYIASTKDQRILHAGLSTKSKKKSRIIREDLLGLDLSGRHFLVMGEGKIQHPIWSETFLSTVSGHLAVALAIEFQEYTIIGEITLLRLSELIANQPVKSRISTLVLDRNGRIIADSHQDRWGQQLNIPPLQDRETDKTRHFSMVQFELGGHQMLGFSVPIRPLDWTVVVADSVESADMPRKAALMALASGLGFALLLALAVAWLQATKLTKVFTQYVEEKQKNHEDLIQAKQAAEAANHAKSTFLANMSHDLRTPLNGIMGMLQLLDKTEVDKQQHEYIEIAQKSSRRLTELLSDILDLSRVEAGKMPLCQKPFNLLHTVDHVRDLFDTTFKHIGVKLNSFVHPEIPIMMLGDAARLQQILNNLLGNAAKFTEKGTVSLEVYPLPQEKPGKTRVLFIIEDTGIGIDSDDLEQLFEPFQQVEENHEQNSKGVGLGLAICKRLVDLMNGHITVESEPGSGTTFSFCVTFGECSAEHEKNRSNETHARQDIANLNILVAEDEPINATTIKLLLENQGCSATVVENGAKALDLLKEQNFDAVFLDIQMPVMDGLETIQAIREGKAGENVITIPTFALTAYAMKGDKERFIEKGMDDYLSKPIDVEELRLLLKKLSSCEWKTKV